MLPPAPGLLSTVTGCPKFFVSSWAIAREAISTAPPGGKGQTKRMGLFGKLWAKALGADSKSPAEPNEMAKLAKKVRPWRSLKFGSLVTDILYLKY